MSPEPLPAKRTVRGEFVKLLLHRRDDRGMTLIEEASRCVRRGELHEVVTTDSDPLPGGRIDRVGFLGFAEIHVAGVIEAGDAAYAGDRLIGSVIGFDACHFPNHYNILIRAGELLTADDVPLAVGDEIAFEAGSPGGA